MDLHLSETYDGKQDHIRDLVLPDIEVFQNIYSDRNYRIELEFPEFTAICPKTGLPDFGVVYLSYVPDQHCLELKSLKEYFFAYRNIGIFHENVVNRICEDVARACKPRQLDVRAVYNVRGGITTTVSTSYKAK
ncbi:MAG: NADPH-dependent 7-cyano-7-deazaguanine reductase QueF [Spirochaetae bacterium HGW-Spirochaetae-10]|nr:MAG: NADPH-dependent 7-cyano-7-deazaguanine reductase QueF [Spirochaetae bacterium HGW-Spirochaetae-10]